MNKQALAELLAAKTEEFTQQGREVIRYASPEKPSKIKLGSHRKIPNLKEQAWQTELAKLREQATA